MAVRFKALPKLGQAFASGELPWTKVREAIKVAASDTEDEWIQRCRELSNRQIEREVRQQEGPVRKKTLVFVLEGDLVDTWEQVREALERLAGQALADIQAFELMCAEVLSTYAATPPFGTTGEDPRSESYARLVAERDQWICQRPGCQCRVGLQGHHIESRALGGSDEASGIVLLCASCPAAVTRGQLRVRGRAPNELEWEAAWGGIIEKPLPLSHDKDPLEGGATSSHVIPRGALHGAERGVLTSAYSRPGRDMGAALPMDLFAATAQLAAFRAMPGRWPHRVPA